MSSSQSLDATQPDASNPDRIPFAPAPSGVIAASGAVESTGAPASTPNGSAPAQTGARDPDREPPPAPADADRRPRLCGPVHGRRKRALHIVEDGSARVKTGAQRLLILDTGQRSGLPAGEFAALVGVVKHTLYKWKQLFEEFGPAGLEERPRGARKGSRVADITQRAILMIKQANPDFGCQRISDMLARGPALPAGASSVARVLHEAGYQVEETPTRPHEPPVRRFERDQANELWQSDLFTFTLKRQNRRVYLVGFLDDHSRFVVSYGLHASQSTILVMEVLRAGIGGLVPADRDGERVILTKAEGGREEVALVPPEPPAPPAPLPEPVCPQANLPEGVADPVEEPPPPGGSRRRWVGVARRGEGPLADPRSDEEGEPWHEEENRWVRGSYEARMLPTKPSGAWRSSWRRSVVGGRQRMRRASWA